MQISKGIFLTLTLLSVLKINAQIDTSFLFSEITISEKFISSSQELLDTNYFTLNQLDLGNYLKHKASCYVRHAGNNGSSFLSINGGAPSHTLLRWNDIPINNSMLGLSDLSLVNLNQFNSIEFESATSEMLASNAIAGQVNFSNHIEDQQAKTEIDISTGSFGLLSGQATLPFYFGDLQSKTHIDFQTIDNDYKIRNAVNEVNENGFFNQFSISNILKYMIDSNKSFTLNSWYQNTQRGISPTSLQSLSLAEQDDQIFRIALQYNQVNNRNNLKFNLAYFNEHNDFSDSLILVNNQNRFDKLFLSGSIHQSISQNFSFRSNLELSHITATSGNYEDGQKITEANLNNTFEYYLEKHKLNFHLNYSSRLDYEGQFNPGSSIQLNFMENTVVNISVARVFRFPTMNEIFWRPGGNPDLVSENGWKQHLTLNTTYKNIDTQVEIYHRSINNWILWTPDDNFGFWRPQNIAQVRNYGFNFQMQKAISFQEINLRFDANYGYVKAVNQSNLNRPFIEKGSQLFYTPEHQFKLNALLQYRRMKLSILQQYYSESIGVNGVVPNYAITNLQLFQRIPSKHNIDLGIIINNIFNSEYYLQENRPMPGINFRFTLKYKFDL